MSNILLLLVFVAVHGTVIYLIVRESRENATTAQFRAKLIAQETKELSK